MTNPTSEPLTVADISDLRAYERERDEFRDRIIALKKRRRIAVGPHITFLFENRDTIRFQVQEMARAERIATDEGIETELRIYNPLIPAVGHLSATLFVELPSDEALREWLPRLVGIETAASFRLPNGDLVPCIVDPAHAAQLTRDEITAAVHYVGWSFSPDQVSSFGPGTSLVIDHEAYPFEIELSAENLAELSGDLRGG